MRNLWPHQQRGLDETLSLIARGERRICITSPTGGGKSEMMKRLIVEYTRQRKKVALYTDRVMLADQISQFLFAEGINHGLRASGREEQLHKDVQICMLQTESSRVLKRMAREHHRADLVLVDEAHKQKADTACALFDRHREEDDATIIGLSATPLELSHVYDHLVVAGTNSELRECGAHVPCRVYAPDEPDTLDIKRQKTGEFVQDDVVKAIMTPVIFGRVYEHWGKLNPDAKPTILFAPGVKESVWFADQFRQKGVRSAHIDGDDGVWVDGEVIGDSLEVRRQVLEDVKSGRIAIICNRFVLREGLDLPSLYHGILATMFGSVVSYIQSVGRLLRSHPSLDHVVLQDHGGNYWRHGDPNADREWDMTRTPYEYTYERMEKMRENEVREPIACLECSYVRQSGPTCPSCGFRMDKRMRRVIEMSGRLTVRYGKIMNPRVVKVKEDTQKVWNNTYWRMKKAKKEMTFDQAYGFFKYEHGYWPPRDLANMPQETVDWCRSVRNVTQERLIQKEVVK